MSQQDVWGAASSIAFELPVSGQDYFAWFTEAARRITIPFRRHYRTQKARGGRGFWLIEDMYEYGNGRGPLVWVEVAPGSTDELTEFTLTPCSDVLSLVTLRDLARKSIAELCGEGDSERGDTPEEPPAQVAGAAEAGRRADAAYDWAYAELERGRSENEVYEEWRKRPEVAERWQQMEDPREAFRSAMKRRKQQGRTKPT